MHIFVTGGAGYIGSHTVHELIDQGHRVTIFDNLLTGLRENIHPAATFIHGDILDDAGLRKALTAGDPVDAVFHFAAFKNAGESMLKPEKYSHTNINGSLVLLNACAELGISRFVFSSSSATYGEPQYLPMDEAHPQEPMSYYGFTKLEIERYLAWYSKLKGIRYAALRYFNAAGYDVKGRVKGKEMNPANLLPIVMEVANGTRAHLYVNGGDYPTRDGTCIRDYIHVNDLATAHVAALDYLVRTDRDLAVNLATGAGYSILEVLETARRVTGKPIPYTIVDRREGDPSEVYATTSQAFALLGWKAEHSDLETLLASMWTVYSKDEV